MDFTFDAVTEGYRQRLLAFMDEHVYPAEAQPDLDALRRTARDLGLWNLFLPGEHGAGLTNLQYAPLAEIIGRSPSLAPAALNCAAPDTGNMEVLAEFGTPQQQERWLKPLLDGRDPLGVRMTEPDVASSDATNIATRIERDGDEYVVNGRKWWITGGDEPATARSSS